MIKVIVAGTRTFSDYELLKSKLDYVLRLRSPEEVEIVCGGARGADALGERYAKERGVKITYFLPDWDKHGKAAGYIRNKQMAEHGTHLILFWDGISKGSKHMLDLANQYGLCVKVIKYASN